MENIKLHTELQSPLLSVDADLVTRKEIFVINDIALVIPPTALSVQKEDMTYTWRTLRTRASTKIPTGHGSINIGVSLVFTNDRMIDLHRLVVQMRASPFCYIENRYLRETIIPEANLYQVMAFCMDAIQISPLEGTSNAWVCQLSLTWFNYFPYAANFMFREEWETEWLEGSGNDETSAIRHGIGWKWNRTTKKREFSPSITDRKAKIDTGVKEWKLQKEGYISKSNRTLFDMEALHLGQEFDMLPLPGNMSPSQIALTPEHSRVYVRYINLLQRDALWDNFEIDIEALLIREGIPLEGFFGVYFDPNGQKQTWGLHSGPTASDESFRIKWYRVIEQVTHLMLNRNGKISFAFQSYMTLDIPNEWSKSLSSLAAVVRDKYRTKNTESDPTYAGDWVDIHYWDASGPKLIRKHPKRSGLSQPNGFRSPLALGGKRLSIKDLKGRVSDRVSQRSPSTDSRLYSGSSKDNGNQTLTGPGRVHWGTDFGTRRSENYQVYAVRPGKVVALSYGTQDASKTIWKAFSIKDNKSTVVSTGALYESWLTTMTTALGQDAVLKSNKKVTLVGNSVSLYQKFGNIIRDSIDSNIYYYTDVGSGGNWIKIQHSGTPEPGDGSYDGDISIYMHLKDIKVNVGDIIGEGTSSGNFHDFNEHIATVGQTGSLSNNYIKWFIENESGAGSGQWYEIPYGRTGSFQTGKFKTLDPFHFDEIVSELGTDTNGGFTLPIHLHFEYWEKESNGTPVDRSVQNGYTKDFNNTKMVPAGYVVVDPVPSFDAAIEDPAGADSWIVHINAISEVKRISEEVLEKKIKDDNGKDYSVDKDKLRNLIDMMQELSQQGWYHYEGAMRLPNVWYKTWILNFRHGERKDVTDPNVTQVNLNKDSSVFDDLSTIVTGLSGGFTNIVARIPILSYEYPTLQHMGSIEPSYSFEFTCLDEHFNIEKNLGLSGISQGGQLIEGMRSVLQRNARKYREVKDSWGIVTDTFITRLLGSYRVDDAVFDNTVEGVVNQVTLLKRTVIDRADNGTVEGNPGLSYISLEMSETNPYDEETFININPPLLDVEAARAEVLQALYNLDIAEEYKGSVLPILIGSLANKGILDPNNDEGYGRFSVSRTDDLAFALGGSQKVIFYEGDEAGYRDSFLVQDQSGVYERLLREQLGEDFDKVAVSKSGILIVTADDSDYGFPEFSEEAFHAEQTVAFVPSRDGRGATVKVDTQMVPIASFDISQLIESSADVSLLAKLDLPKIADYWQLVDALVKSADISLAEEASATMPNSSRNYTKGGLPTEYIKKELYDLPVVPSMWRLWQYYQLLMSFRLIHFEQTVKTVSKNLNEFLGIEDYDALVQVISCLSEGSRIGSAEAGPARLRNNRGWIEWNNPTEATELTQLVTGMDISTGDLAEMAWAGAKTIPSVIFEIPILAFWDLYTYVSSLNYDKKFSDLDTAVFPHFLLSATENAEDQIVEYYLRHMYPSTAIWLQDLAKYYAKDALFAPIVALIDGNEGPLASVHSQLQENLHSCGYWSFGLSDGPIGKTQGSFVPRFVLKAEDFSSTNDGTIYIANSNPVPSGVTGIEAYNASFKWPVDQDTEKKKVREFKVGLARLADDILSSPKMLTAFGLQKYVNLLASQKTIKGTECYPDLVLPAHPYYGDTRDVPPDFYFWNMYDDGGAFGPEAVQKIRESADHIVSNCYKSLQVMQGRNDTANDMPYTNTGVSDQQIPIPLRFNAEGTDGKSQNPSNVGHIGIPWYESDVSKDAIAKFETDALAKSGETLDSARKVEATFKRATDINYAAISRPNPTTASISVVEGQLGNIRGGIQYPLRAQAEVYEKLQGHLDSSRKMFGSKAGYSSKQFDENVPVPESAQAQKTALEKPLEYTHLFDEASLKQLAFDASRDIISQKMTMRRAFPTFKLFFIEEDEIEDHLIAYDDFHSYNAVKEFTVVQSRKIAADVAMITIQNVSGSLDGTRRDAVTDVDYFSIKPKTKNKSDNTLSGDAIVEGTDAEQPFQAVVLRPGMNVQLRAGYANDPRNLHVMISGRVVDITWNKTGDMTEIMVQGFGVELQQALKGTESNGAIYYTTHHLLGSMMLQSELVHFGRWERGQLFQEDEAQDSRLDFYDYSREGFLGKFSMTTTITSWFTRHPFISLGLAFGFGAISLWTPGSGKIAVQVAAAEKGAALSWFQTALKGTGRFLAGTKDATYGVKTQIAGARETMKFTTSGSLTALIPKALQAEIKLAGLGGLKAESKALLQTILEGTNASTLAAARKLAGFGAAHEAEVLKLTEELLEATGKASTVQNLVSAFASFNRGVNSTILTGGLLGNPVRSLLTSPLGFLSWNTAKTVSGVGLRAVTIGASQVTLAAVLVGGALDLLKVTVFDGLYDITIGRIQKWFATAQVSMMITPQDDNIFCPHPKDYMDLKETGILSDAFDYAMANSLEIFLHENSGYKTLRWINKESIFDKRVVPQACQYQIETATIWDIFHEMSLRHPGWIYGVRPYGHAFRNTMFFGVPSQRYWAKPASNEFIQRVNKLSKFLAEDGINLEEYRQLYGNEVEGQNIDELEARFIEEERATGLSQQEMADLLGMGNQTPSEPQYLPVRGAHVEAAKRARGDGFYGELAARAQADTVKSRVQDSAAATADAAQKARTRLKAVLSAQAIKEYLRGLELRFVPFRNHHMISSTRDLVWNGIMSSENAVYNAVSVTYFDEIDGQEKSSNTTTEIFKAHAFIPEHMIRVLPLPVYRNCISYNMGVRYAMGTLMDTMKDMYRGEIIVMGNPRLRPWDIAIMTDDYNDMVGPIEIEQVVHTFSHETGFITEIKPSAVVIANEISSWPLLEAAKLWTLAVRDVENKYAAGPAAGLMDDVATILKNTISPIDQKTLELKYKQMYGSEFPFIQDLATDKEFTESLEPWDRDIAALATAGKAVSAGVIGATGVAAALVGAAFAAKLPGGRSALSALGCVAGVGLVGVGGTLALATQTPPSLKMLIGGTVLFAQMAREESLILVPLIKNGQPIVSGLNIQDPSMMWTHFKGNLKRAVSDTIEGTEDLMRLWDEHSTGAWEKLSQAWDDSGAIDPKTKTGNPDLTGEE